MLLDMLPPIVHLQSETDREACWAFDRTRQELADSKPGSFLIVRQLVYMIFVQALRLHLDEGKGVGWLFALFDKNARKNRNAAAPACRLRDSSRHP